MKQVWHVLATGISQPHLPRWTPVPNKFCRSGHRPGISRVRHSVAYPSFHCGGGETAKPWRPRRPIAAYTIPMFHVDATANPFSKGRVWPRMWAFDVPMLHGIVMDVIHVAGEISVVADRMLPKPLLPDAANALGTSRGRYAAFNADAGRQIRACEPLLDLPPAS